MNVQKTLLFTLSLLLSAIAFDGCSSLATQTPRFRTETAEKPRQQLPEKKSEIIQPVALDTSYFVNLQRLESGLNDDSTKIDDEQYAKEIALLLERARTYYIGALDAHTKEDSLNASEKFEAAITILNELSSMPQIENNTEFNDISKSVIEDYEKYIANVDSLGQNSSVFALREKLNQFLSAETAPSDGIAKEHIKGTTIPLVINGHVEKNIYYLQKKAPHHFKFWMEQS
ncbi:MAG: hypothetical protein KGZ58_10785, partial [Ignavibacteriales bacterium]|nr:hypothetical protein [Ignavibacteriales bacterium]